MIKLTSIGLLFSLFIGSGLVQASEVKVGDQAPAFELVSSEGKKVSLKDYAGKKNVIVTFNRAHWCPFCMANLRDLSKDYSKFSAEGAELLVIFREEKDGLEGMKKSAKFSKGLYPILLDAKAEKTKAYSEEGYDTYVIDKAGKVAAKIEGTKKQRVSNEEILKAVKAIAK